MSSTQTSSKHESIGDTTVKFIEEVISEYSANHNLARQIGIFGSLPIHRLEMAAVTKEYCDLEYPGLGHTCHFRSGVELRVTERHGQLLLEFFTRPGQTSVASLDLMALETSTTLGAFRTDNTRKIEQALTATLEANEAELSQYKKPKA